MTTSNTERLYNFGGEGADPPPLTDRDLSADLTMLVERVRRNNMPWVVVSGSAVTAWQERDPVGWEKVSGWLAAKGVAIVQI